MAITDISVTDIANFADGHEFGAAGAYVRIKGVARGMLEPAAAGNTGIVDLDKASLNAKGLVDYATDFDILRPKDPLCSSAILVYDVPNRGAKRIFNLLDDIPANDPARTNDPKTQEDAGLGFCLGRGYSLVWSGWDPGAPKVNGNLGADIVVGPRRAGVPARPHHGIAAPEEEAEPGVFLGSRVVAARLTRQDVVEQGEDAFRAAIGHVVDQDA